MGSNLPASEMKARFMAEIEMQRLGAVAEKMLDDAENAITEDIERRALDRATEIFDSAPWLAFKDNTTIGGCLNLTYNDLFVLFRLADSLGSVSV